MLLALWSPPRCRSTAFWRMVTERGDFATFHEPFVHLTEHGQVDLAGRTVRTEAELIAALSTVASTRPVFFKDTTDHVYPAVLADEAFLRRTTHTFLIRHSREAIPSHYAVHPRGTLEEIGFARLRALYDVVTAATGNQPVVVDAGDLVTRPEAVVRAWCARVGIDGTVASADHQLVQAGLMRPRPARVPAPRSGFAGFGSVKLTVCAVRRC